MNENRSLSNAERWSENMERARETTVKLYAYCRANHWAGYDPYDALNSRLFQGLHFLDFKLARLVLTQGVKRCPINLRPLLLVPKSPNPKGIALFLSALIKLRKIGLVEDDHAIRSMADQLMALRSPDSPYACWGYNFDWQTRGGLVPKGSPNIICSTFAANSLLDAYERWAESSYLQAAVSAAEFILNVLFWRKNDDQACFSYTPVGRDEIHNANLLGAALLCRISRVTGRKELLQPALETARYSVSRQHEDGAWDYGEASSQRWIDNFHTGYNLVALRRIGEYGETKEFEKAVSRGLIYYRDHFFRTDGSPRYYHDAAFPIDIHSVAQSIITLLSFEDQDAGNFGLAHSVLRWAMAHMWDARGYFYYQRWPAFTVRIPFMRWSQAWMLLALATFLERDDKPGGPHPPSLNPE
jgi:hypothetical protein